MAPEFGSGRCRSSDVADVILTKSLKADASPVTLSVAVRALGPGLIVAVVGNVALLTTAKASADPSRWPSDVILSKSPERGGR
jgi:hypothetical protein